LAVVVALVSLFVCPTHRHTHSIPLDFIPGENHSQKSPRKFWGNATPFAPSCPPAIADVAVAAVGVAAVGAVAAAAVGVAAAAVSAIQTGKHRTSSPGAPCCSFELESCRAGSWR